VLVEPNSAALLPTWYFWASVKCRYAPLVADALALLAVLTFSFAAAMAGDGITLLNGPLGSGRLVSFDRVECLVFLIT